MHKSKPISTSRAMQAALYFRRRLWNAGIIPSSDAEARFSERWVTTENSRSFIIHPESCGSPQQSRAFGGISQLPCRIDFHGIAWLMTEVKDEHTAKTKLSFRRKLLYGISAFFLVFIGWGGWQISTYNKAVTIAREAGFYWEHKTPFSIIQEDWRNAFKKHTWGSYDRILQIENISDLDVYSDMLKRLQPNDLYFQGCSKLENVDALQTFNNLKDLHLCNCTMLQNVDGLKNQISLRRLLLYACSSLQNIDGLERITDLEYLDLCGCTELKNVNCLKNITSLRYISLEDCHKIPAADLRELQAALPNTNITFPDGTTTPPQ